MAKETLSELKIKEVIGVRVLSSMIFLDFGSQSPVCRNTPLGDLCPVRCSFHFKLKTQNCMCLLYKDVRISVIIWTSSFTMSWHKLIHFSFTWRPLLAAPTLWKSDLLALHYFVHASAYVCIFTDFSIIPLSTSTVVLVWFLVQSIFAQESCVSLLFS